MKLRVFKRYKNRKLYCPRLKKYVNFAYLVECIRDGYRIGIIPHGTVMDETQALLNGSRHLIKCFSKNIDSFSNSTVTLLVNVLYDSWLLQGDFDFESYKEGACIN